MGSKAQRRHADIDLWKGARAIKRDRSNPRKMRKAAGKIAAAFWLRVAFRIHSNPSRLNLFLSGGFRYGEYGGVDWGISAGNVKDPIDKLDALCLAHDMAYATVEQLEHYYDMRELIEGDAC